VAVVARPPEAERRQLTVLFCDLVASMALASHLDPEDLRTVVQAYQATCAEVIQRFDGHIAQYLGDGLLVYFGYPQAHEDDAQRAVRCGLGIVEAVGALQTRLEREYEVHLAVRLGIHTGLVVIGEVGGGGRQEQLALGETPNIAARLQGLTAPDTVVISEATARLIHGFFVCQPLGAQALKGLHQPLQVYRVLQESGAQTRLDVATARGLTPLVGRDEEVALLQRRWDQAAAGMGQVVLLSGEAGLGKSRLVQVLKEHLTAVPHTRIEWRGSPYHQHSALSPVIDQLQRWLRGHHEVPPSEPLQTLEAALTAAGIALAEAMPLLAALLSLPLPASYAPLTVTPQRQRQKTLELLLAWLSTETQQQPVLLIVEDLHWVDPSTLELLSLLIDQCAPMRLCLILTTRPEFHPPWAMVAHFTALTLRRLAPDEVARLVLHVVGDKAFPPAVLQEVVGKTDGVPLFVEELIKTVLASGLLEEQTDRYVLHGPLPPLAIPTTLQDALVARLDRLAAAKVVAQLGATIGRTFAYDVVQAVALLDAATLQAALTQLVAAEVLAQRGLPPQATYTFKHALIQEAAYQSLLRSTRQQYHQRIAQVVEAQGAETVERQPELLAHHYTAAGLSAQALPYWQRAGQHALQRSAYVEALSHLTHGLEVLQALPESPERTQHELALQLPLGAVLMATKGYAAPEVEHVYARALALSRQVRATPQMWPTLRGLHRFYLVRAQHQTARSLGEQCLQLAQQMHDPVVRLEAQLALGESLFYLGELAAARGQLEAGLTHCTPATQALPAFRAVQHPEVAYRFHLGLVLWLLGYPAQAATYGQALLPLARTLAHPLSLAYALAATAVWQHLGRDVHGVHDMGEAAHTFAAAQAFPLFAAEGALLHGWARTELGQWEAGLAQMAQGLRAWQQTGARLLQPYFLALLAAAHGHGGQGAEGLRLLAEALAAVAHTRERWWEAELYRLKGELLMAQRGGELPQGEDADACFHQALVVARHQQAKALELRAAISRARLWQQQGKRDEAYTLLAPVYAWFTEGFDTADLQEAQALLAALAPLPLSTHP
jgi:predicted ATPase/class 3 adenylate cyclase